MVAVRCAAQQASAIVEGVVVVDGQDLGGNHGATIVADDLAVAFLNAGSLEDIQVGIAIVVAVRCAAQQAGAIVEGVVVVDGQDFLAQQSIAILAVGLGNAFLNAGSLEGIGVGLTVLAGSRSAFSITLPTTLRALLPDIASLATGGGQFLHDFVLMLAAQGSDFVVMLPATLGALLPDITRLGAGSGIFLHDFVLVLAAQGSDLVVRLPATLGALLPDITGLGAGSGIFLHDFVLVLAAQGSDLVVVLIAALRALLPDITGLSAGSGIFLHDFVVVVTHSRSGLFSATSTDTVNEGVRVGVGQADFLAAAALTLIVCRKLAISRRNQNGVVADMGRCIQFSFDSCPIITGNQLGSVTTARGVTAQDAHTQFGVLFINYPVDLVTLFTGRQNTLGMNMTRQQTDDQNKGHQHYKELLQFIFLL